MRIMLQRIVSGFIAILITGAVLAPGAASAALKISYQKKFSNATISAAKKYGGGLSTKTCLTSASTSLAKTYAQKGKTTTAQRRAAIKKVETCGGVEVGVQVSKQKTAKKVVSKATSANKKRLKKKSHTWVGARTYKKKKTYYTVLIVAAPKPSLHLSLSNDVLNRVHQFNKGGSTTDSCLQTHADAWGKKLSTKGSSTADQRRKVMADAALNCELDSVRLYHSKHTSASSAAKQVRNASSKTWEDPNFNRVGARVWAKGNERFTVVMVGQMVANAPDPTPPGEPDFPVGPYLPEEMGDEFLPFTPWFYETKPYILQSTEYCQRWSHKRRGDSQSPAVDMSITAYWDCHTLPSPEVMQNALVDAANQARVNQTRLDGIPRSPFPYRETCFGGFQQEFTDWKVATFGTDANAWRLGRPHSPGWEPPSGRKHIDGILNCHLGGLDWPLAGEIVIYGREQHVQYRERGIDPKSWATGYVNGWLSSTEGHRGWLLLEDRPGHQFRMDLGFSCTPVPERWGTQGVADPFCTASMQPGRFQLISK